MPRYLPSNRNSRAKRILSTLFAASFLMLLSTRWSVAQNDSEKVIHIFQGDSSPGGASPWDGVVVDSAGNVYGGALYGGLYNGGLIFKMSPNGDGTWAETAAHNFDDSDYNDGAGPLGGLVFDSAGNLYGTTIGGGEYNAGVAFELKPGAHGRWVETILHNFGGYSDGTEPRSTMILDASGNLYGTTSEGGANGQGIVFELSRNSAGEWQETILYNFTLSDGGDGFSAQPLAFDKSGNLWGTVEVGGAYGFGEIYELSPGSGGGEWLETVVHNFANGSDGEYPDGGLLLDAHGNFYGTTAQGGTGYHGTIFELSPSVGGGWSLNTLHNFTGFDGEGPVGNLTFGPSGSLYGATQAGGEFGQGSVYVLKPAAGGAWNLLTLHSLRGAQEGCGPDAGVSLDSAGNLYDAALYCGIAQGSYGVGTVFEIVLAQ
jgi:uncharacterized repeat protein (TIGR03803 family)